ncbi:hypothetical protein CsatB_009620 [Cannabis sativa]
MLIQLAEFCTYCGRLDHVFNECGAVLTLQEQGIAPIPTYDERIRIPGLPTYVRPRPQVIRHFPRALFPSPPLPTVPRVIPVFNDQNTAGGRLLLSEAPKGKEKAHDNGDLVESGYATSLALLVANGSSTLSPHVIENSPSSSHAMSFSSNVMSLPTKSDKGKAIQLEDTKITTAMASLQGGGSKRAKAATEDISLVKKSKK